MSTNWSQKITVVGMDNEPAWSLYCEPEGNVLEVEPGDVLTLTFAWEAAHGFEIAQVSGGVVLCRLGDSVIEIEDKRGRDLRW
jgi:hypothetical protein